MRRVEAEILTSAVGRWAYVATTRRALEGLTGTNVTRDARRRLQEEAELPDVPTTHFTDATRLLSEVAVTAALRDTFDLPTDVKRIDILCPPH